MADKDEKSLIGYNPLAWMEEEPADLINDSDAKDDANTNIEAIVSNVVVEKVETKIELKNASSIKSPESVSEQNQDDSKLILEARNNIQNVTELYSHLKVLLDNNNIIEIDASAVKIIDTSTLQLLIILKQTAIKLHKEVVIDFPSDQFIEAAELLGLSEMLEVDHAAAGLF